LKKTTKPQGIADEHLLQAVLMRAVEQLAGNFAIVLTLNCLSTLSVITIIGLPLAIGMPYFFVMNLQRQKMRDAVTYLLQNGLKMWTLGAALLLKDAIFFHNALFYVYRIRFWPIQVAIVTVAAFAMIFTTAIFAAAVWEKTESIRSNCPKKWRQSVASAWMFCCENVSMALGLGVLHIALICIGLITGIGWLLWGMWPFPLVWFAVWLHKQGRLETEHANWRSFFAPFSDM